MWERKKSTNRCQTEREADRFTKKTLFFSKKEKHEKSKFMLFHLRQSWGTFFHHDFCCPDYQPLESISSHEPTQFIWVNDELIYWHVQLTWGHVALIYWHVDVTCIRRSHSLLYIRTNKGHWWRLFKFRLKKLLLLDSTFSVHNYVFKANTKECLSKVMYTTSVE